MLFDWFCIVQRNNYTTSSAPSDVPSPEKKKTVADIVFSCLDDYNTPHNLKRFKTLVTELTFPFKESYVPKLLHSKQLEFFFFENGDGTPEKEIVHVACLLQCEKETIYTIISHHDFYGEFQDILLRLSSLKLTNDVLMKLVEEIVQFCGTTTCNRISIFSFQSEVLPSFCVKPRAHKDEDLALVNLFSKLELDHLLDLFCLLLLEGNLYITSNKLYKISTTVCVLQKLLRPFTWLRTKIALLSPHMVPLCSVPMPIIIGLHHSLLEDAIFEIKNVNLRHAPDSNTTGFYVLLNLDAVTASEKFERMDSVNRNENKPHKTHIHSMFPPSYVHDIKSVWKRLLKRLNSCEITIDEFSRSVFSSTQTFIAQLILGYKDCYYVKEASELEQRQHERNKNQDMSSIQISEMESHKQANSDHFVVDFDKNKFVEQFELYCGRHHNAAGNSISTHLRSISPSPRRLISGSGSGSASSSHYSSAKNIRASLTGCQFFEEFVLLNKPDCGVTVEGEVKLIKNREIKDESLKQFDTLYNWVLKAETEKESNRNHSLSVATAATKIGFDHIQSAYSKLSDQRSQLQTEMKSRTSLVKNAFTSRSRTVSKAAAGEGGNENNNNKHNRLENSAAGASPERFKFSTFYLPRSSVSYSSERSTITLGMPSKDLDREESSNKPRACTVAGEKDFNGKLELLSLEDDGVSHQPKKDDIKAEGTDKPLMAAAVASSDSVKQSTNQGQDAITQNQSSKETNTISSSRLESKSANLIDLDFLTNPSYNISEDEKLKSYSENFWETFFEAPSEAIVPFMEASFKGNDSSYCSKETESELEQLFATMVSGVSSESGVFDLGDRSPHSVTEGFDDDFVPLPAQEGNSASNYNSMNTFDSLYSPFDHFNASRDENPFTVGDSSFSQSSNFTNGNDHVIKYNPFM